MSNLAHAPPVLASPSIPMQQQPVGLSVGCRPRQGRLPRCGCSRARTVSFCCCCVLLSRLFTQALHVLFPSRQRSSSALRFSGHGHGHSRCRGRDPVRGRGRSPGPCSRSARARHVPRNAAAAMRGSVRGRGRSSGHGNSTLLTPRSCAPCPTQRSSSNRCSVVVRGRVSPGDQGAAARASSAMCPMVVAVIVAVVVLLANAAVARAAGRWLADRGTPEAWPCPSLLFK